MSNFKNILIAIIAPLPSVILYLSFLHNVKFFSDDQYQHSFFIWCNNHPFLLANLLFFINVEIIFWVIGVIQSSLWLLDLYWFLAPVMLTHFYASHPLSSFNWLRSRVVIFMTWIWGVRLGHNYLRREKWELGAREDWRFAKLRKQYGGSWWWLSFFVVYIFQQVFIIGNCLPIYAIHSTEIPWNIWDAVAVIVCIGGITIACIADTQLFHFMQKKNKLNDNDESTILDKGLWRCSRRPNYFGEQMWWWGLAIFGWNVGQTWTVIGAFTNTLCLAYVTSVVEERMLMKEARAAAYRSYQKTTSVWIPWFKFSSQEIKVKSI